MQRHTNDPTVVQRLLTEPGTWAVVGLSTNRARTAYGVADFVRRLGHRVVPVHPHAPEVFGQTGYAALADIPEDLPVDVVDCFVNSRLVGAVVDQAIEQRERLGIRALWLQLGVIDQAAARRARGVGLDVVMDTCPKIEWRGQPSPR